MPINDEQAKQIKEQLLPQISQLPQNQQEQAKKYIESMSNEQLEQFLKQNQATAKQQGQTSPTSQESKSSKTPDKNQCIFCSISNKQIEAFAIYEDKDYLAALEINPFSKGHIILIPKKHIKETKSLSSKAYTLANRVGKHIIKKLKAESFQVTTTSEAGHAIINIIPVYKNQPLTYQRIQTDKKDLQETAIKIGEVKKITRKPRQSKAKKQTKEQTDNKSNNILKLPRRIP